MVVASPAEPHLRTSRFTGPPLFISGCNRGGTTILSQILAAHPEVRNVGRGQFNEGRHVWRSGFRDWSRHRWAVPPFKLILRRTAKHATPKRCAFFRNAFERSMVEEGRMLEKTPANAVRIPFIDRLYPDCYFVHVLRDGRHTSASLVARRVWWVYAPHQWVGAHRTALGDLAALLSHRVTVVRYEDLVEEPARVMEEICRRCDLTWRDAEREAVTTAARQLLHPVECRWDRFSAWKKDYVLRVIGELQAELGYPVER